MLPALPTQQLMLQIHPVLGFPQECVQLSSHMEGGRAAAGQAWGRWAAQQPGREDGGFQGVVVAVQVFLVKLHLRQYNEQIYK